ncbi:MAG: response regulator transcription factor [Bacteroidales bacterium]|nr:response regulator transcription factor [Bacteroidales bacterium]MDE6802371.1 response regulator [Muribaculaceae bacterium]
MLTDSQNNSVVGHILIASSDPDDQLQIRSSFEREGYHVDCIETLPDAIRSNLSHYEMILMNFPEDTTTGIHTIENIRQTVSCATIPLLVLSKASKCEILVQALNAGADDYIIKPFSLRELNARVRAILRSARRG